MFRAIRNSWRLNQQLDPGTNPPQVNAILDSVKDHLAAAKLLGAGGGGFMLFFVPPEKRRELRVRLKNLLCVPFSFSNRGSHVVVHEPDQVYDKSLVAERSEVYAQQSSSKD